MSIRQGAFKLVGKELFNIERDPTESQDIAVAHPEIYQTLHKRLLELGELDEERATDGRKVNCQRIECINGNIA